MSGPMEARDPLGGDDEQVVDIFEMYYPLDSRRSRGMAEVDVGRAGVDTFNAV